MAVAVVVVGRVRDGVGEDRDGGSRFIDQKFPDRTELLAGGGEQRRGRHGQREEWSMGAEVFWHHVERDSKPER